MIDNAISDLYVQNGDDDLEFRDGITEACLIVHAAESSHIWLSPEHITDLRDWCDDWLLLHATTTIGGAE